MAEIDCAASFTKKKKKRVSVFLAAFLGFLIGKSLLAQYICDCVHSLQASVCQAKKEENL